MDGYSLSSNGDKNCYYYNLLKFFLSSGVIKVSSWMKREKLNKNPSWLKKEKLKKFKLDEKGKTQ